MMKLTIEVQQPKDEQIQDMLIKEYELALSSLYKLENAIWQTGSIFIALSVGGISILFTRGEHTWANLAVVTVIAMISAYIATQWNQGIYHRWYDMQRVLFYRMREIEQTLGVLWMERYIYYLDETRLRRQQDFAPGEEEARFRRLDHHTKGYASKSTRSRMAALVTVLKLGWAFLVMYELVLTLPTTAWHAVASYLGLH